MLFAVLVLDLFGPLRDAILTQHVPRVVVVEVIGGRDRLYAAVFGADRHVGRLGAARQHEHACAERGRDADQPHVSIQMLRAESGGASAQNAMGVQRAAQVVFGVSCARTFV